MHMDPCYAVPCFHKDPAHSWKDGTQQATDGLAGSARSSASCKGTTMKDMDILEPVGPDTIIPDNKEEAVAQQNNFSDKEPGRTRLVYADGSAMEEHAGAAAAAIGTEADG